LHGLKVMEDGFMFMQKLPRNLASNALRILWWI